MAMMSILLGKGVEKKLTTSIYSNKCKRKGIKNDNDNIIHPLKTCNYMLSSKNKPYPFRQLFYAVGSNQIL